ncbi:MAG TPA: hypothetical protein VG603_09295 [Chitinophagales bacterium]|nr:hypothetical protein [Chitinophagales bacterium]
MKRLLPILVLICITVAVYAQTDSLKAPPKGELLLHESVSSTILFTRHMMLNDSLIHARRVYTAGIGLMLCGPGLLVTGIATLTLDLALGNDTYFRGLIAGTVLIALSPLPVLIGIPVLAVGLKKYRKFQRLSNNVRFQTGILFDGTVGMAMHF